MKNTNPQAGIAMIPFAVVGLLFGALISVNPGHGDGKEVAPKPVAEQYVNAQQVY